MQSCYAESVRPGLGSAVGAVVRVGEKLKSKSATPYEAIPEKRCPFNMSSTLFLEGQSHAFAP